MARHRSSWSRSALLFCISILLGLLACDSRDAAQTAAYPSARAPAPLPPPPYASSSSSPGGSPGCGRAPTHTGFLAGQHVRAGGRDRTYTLVVPEAYAADLPYPLVFVLHGSGGNSAAARAQTDLEKVSGGHAIFVYPQGLGGAWNLDDAADRNGDVALFDAISLVAHNALCIDPHRIFVTGFSNGAYMANQLACRRGDRIRGVVTHAGGGPYELHGTYDAQGRLVCSGKAVASLVVHGSSDNVVAPAEGQKSLDHWSQANRCAGGTASAWISPCVAVQGCVQPVGICRIPGLGHGAWRDAGKVTWAFFDALR